MEIQSVSAMVFCHTSNEIYHSVIHNFDTRNQDRVACCNEDRRAWQQPVLPWEVAGAVLGSRARHPVLRYNLTSPGKMSLHTCQLAESGIVLSPRTSCPRRPLACLALANRSAEQIALRHVHTKLRRGCQWPGHGSDVAATLLHQETKSLSICMKLDVPGLYVFFLREELYVF
jgi:hypothetical protein